MIMEADLQADVAAIHLTDVLAQFRRMKTLADKAFEQVSDEHLFRSLGAEEDNSIAIIAKHLAGNMRSRWRDFLTTDGEKPDRNRDEEFEGVGTGTRVAMLEGWESGWRELFGTLEHLTPPDLQRTVRIRGEAMPAIEAINRALGHQAYHVGQIVLLAKHFAGENWRSLSIPKRRR